MNFLFYLDPSIEFNNSNFRYTSFRNSVLPQAKALVESGHNVSIIVNSVIAESAERDGLDTDGIDLVIIDIIDALNIGNFSNIALSTDKDKEKRICELLNKKWDKRSNPDVIIVWESVSTYLPKVFNTSKIIYQTPGFFSRPPFPQLISLNSGLLENSESPEIYPRVNLESFDKIRNELKDFFLRTSSIANKIKKLKRSFKKLILFPLQIDGYFMIDSQIKDKKQIHILCEILDEIPNDIALIVTEYRSKDINSNVLDEYIKDTLKKKHLNFIYDDEINSEFCVSQQLLPLVDGVITVSSSVGLQAAFWELPLLVFGNNYISKFQTATSIKDLLLNLGIKFNQDGRICSSLIYQNIPVPGKYINSEDWVKNLFSYLNGKPNNLLHCSEWLGNNLRKKEYLRAIRYNSSEHVDREHCSELNAQIKKHKIISFDIFDTLLMRPFLAPSDLFKFIETKVRNEINDQTFDFVNKRRNAEKKAFENSNCKGDGETTIEEIYTVLCSANDIPEEKKKALIDIEIDTEKSVLYRRECIYNAYLLATSLNKKIIITSDMYLPKCTIEEILKINKIEYDKLYLSSEIKKKKSSGELFEYILEDMQCKPDEILHVGDNVKGDLVIPKSKGIHCFHMPRTIEKMLNDETGFYKNIWKRDERNHTISARSILAVLGNYYYDNAYLILRKNTLFNGNTLNLGFMGFGPLLLGYAKWLCEEGIRKKITDYYFLARDGKIMKEAYDIIAKHYKNSPQSHYMLCSRRSVNLCKIKDFSGINDLLHVDFATNIRLDSLIKNRFGINPSQIPEEIYRQCGVSADKRISNSDVEILYPFFKKIQSFILSESNKERNNYLDYLNKIKFYSPEKKIGIVDIGYAGTMQQSLFEITGIKTFGFYFITFRKALERLQKSELESYGYLGNFIDRHDTCEPFCRYVPLFETMFSSTDTSFVKFAKINKNLTPIFIDSCPNENTRKQIVTQIHEGALKFIEIFSNSFKENLKYLDIEPFKSERMLLSFFSNPDARDARLLQGIIFEDAYGGKSEKVILPLDMNYNGEVVWKNGFNSLKKVSTIKDNQKDHTSKADQFETKTRLRREIILKIYKKILTPIRYQKLESRPEEFFRDSKNFITKNIVSKIYL